MSGIRTPNIQQASLIDSVVGNRGGSTRRQPVADLAYQLAQTAPLNLAGSQAPLFATEALMRAAVIANKVSAWVYNDPNPEKNGIWSWQAGDWVWTLPLPYSVATLDNDNAGTPNAIVATSRVPLTDGMIVILPITATNTAFPVTVAVNDEAVRTIKTVSGNDVVVGGLITGMDVVMFVKGGTFRLSGDQASAAIVAQAEAAAADALAAAEAAAAATSSKADINSPVFQGGSGLEGGAINLLKPSSGGLSGNVTLDVAADGAGNDFLRIFEAGGTHRGAKIKLNALIAGLASEVLTDTILKTTGGAALVGFKRGEAGAADKLLSAILSRVINVADFGPETMGEGLVDCSSYIQAAVSAAEARGGGYVIFPQGTLRMSAPLVINSNAVTLDGQGAFAGGTTLLTYFTGDIITFNGNQYSGISNIRIAGETKHTAGYGVVLAAGCFGCFVENVRLDYLFNGVRVSGKEENRVNNLTMRYMLGVLGVHYVGTAASKCYRLTVENIRADNPFSVEKSTVMGRSRVNSTAYPLGAIIEVGNYLWQCTTAGTTASAAPAGLASIPGTVGSNVYSTAVADGTAAWKFLGGKITWIVQDSYAYSLVVSKGAVLRGYGGIKQTDSLNDGSSFPMWCWNYDLECEHQFDRPCWLERGEGFYATTSYFCASSFASGVVVDANYRGDFAFTARCRISLNAQHGVLVAAGAIDWVIANSTITDNGGQASNTYDGIHVNGNAAKFVINGNFIGDGVSVSGNPQRYGVVIDAGTGHFYNICNNVVPGNVTGAISDNGTGSGRVVANNSV